MAYSPRGALSPPQGTGWDEAEQGLGPRASVRATWPNSSEGGRGAGAAPRRPVSWPWLCEMGTPGQAKPLEGQSGGHRVEGWGEGGMRGRGTSFPLCPRGLVPRGRLSPAPSRPAPHSPCRTGRHRCSEGRGHRRALVPLWIPNPVRTGLGPRPAPRRSPRAVWLPLWAKRPRSPDWHRWVRRPRQPSWALTPTGPCPAPLCTRAQNKPTAPTLPRSLMLACGRHFFGH